MPDHAPHTAPLPATRRPYLFRDQPASDGWQLVREGQATTDTPCIVPLTQWLEEEPCDLRAPWLAADTELDQPLTARLAEAPLVAIDFPKFTDGRGYSLARLLRERHGYHGEIRAIGDVLVDQLFYMRRCGFDGFSLREDQWLEDALRNLQVFSRAYQPGVDQPEPLFRLRGQALELERDERPQTAFA
ncbi:DUF934 domain-containing protein [Halomonas marinisediminis]|uniref:DUF934 domain-containing protein n=1 Tax=Halomonas marinisediminis TaxID=2546095 RepID=A0ABY2DB05_9GAMM|nr:DUF934 domain-containing protein [Halomonas marinisediminis]TDB05499.1 DUF934 domain-containing protein [Halomonas marinisediminis]